MKTLLKVFLILILPACLAVRSSSAEENVVFCDNFTEIEDLASAGWKLQDDIGPTKFELTKDNGLKIVHCTVPYRGDKIAKAIPAARKGYLDFEAKIGNANNRHFSLQVYLFGQLTSFNGYGVKRINWNRYEGAPAQKHHDIMINITPDTWHKFRIFFDADEKSFEFFVDNMDDPVDVHMGVPFDPSKAEHLFVVLGDYALCPGEVINYVKNVKFTEIK
ncbi:MAG: hypothetical protein JW957_03195 [Candidatus Omnitrophica bacterium]|nr:hypothetical protein [Candidatus Omnitrophota bacterium]